jgi:hypothetical protein
MNCSFSTVTVLITIAIALLVAAIVISGFWVTAIPLFVAASLVAAVSFGLIPAIRNALGVYAQCRGSLERCSISPALNTLGQAAAILSVISFAAAAILQVAALAFLYSWFLAWLGVSIEAAVALMVTSGQYSCAVTVFILLGVLANAWAFKNCADEQVVGPAAID